MSKYSHLKGFVKRAKASGVSKKNAKNKSSIFDRLQTWLEMQSFLQYNRFNDAMATQNKAVQDMANMSHINGLNAHALGTFGHTIV